jgi:hypothetical protein
MTLHAVVAVKWATAARDGSLIQDKVCYGTDDCDDGADTYEEHEAAVALIKLLVLDTVSASQL